MGKHTEGRWSSSFGDVSFYGGRMSHVADADGVFQGRMKSQPSDNYAGGGWTVIAADGSTVVSGTWTTANRDRVEKTVRLISAAPTMLEALELVQASIVMAKLHASEQGRNNVLDAAFTFAQVAIEQATEDET